MHALLLASLLAVAPAQEPATPAASAPEAIGEAMMADPRFQRMEAGIHVVRLDDGSELFGWNAQAPMVPASATKLVTAAAALDALGPSFTWSTSVWATAEPSGGVVDGDLVLVGGADPTLVVEKLWRLFRDLKADGVEEITGDVLLDDTYLEDAPRIPGWDNARDLEEGPSYFPAIGALAHDFGALTLVVRPGAAPGEAARVAVQTPAGSAVVIEGEVETGPERSRTRLVVQRRVRDGRLVFDVSGQVPVDGDARHIRRAVADPTVHTLGVVEALLADVGIRVGGRVREGERPVEAVRLASLSSPPLSSVLMDANKYSSNFMAETVLRTLGAEISGEGSTEAGLAVVRAWLDAQGIPRSDAVVVNGSGLSRDTRLTPAALTAAIRAAAATPRTGPEFTASMAIGGLDGTLRRRFDDWPGRVRGKTGTLAGVHALAGILEAEDGTRYAFAFLANEVRGGLTPVKDLMDAFLAEVARAGVASR